MNLKLKLLKVLMTNEIWNLFNEIQDAFKNDAFKTDTIKETIKETIK